MEFEHALLRTPCDDLLRSLKQAQKLEKDFIVVRNALTTLQQREKDSPNVANTVGSLDKIIAKLKSTREKAKENAAILEKHSSDMQSRCGYLEGYAEVVGSPEETRRRTHRLIAQYLLHEGFTDVATSLAQRSNISHLVDFSNLGATNLLMQQLLEKKVVTDTLAWCIDNRTKLKKIGSTLELQLRIQEGVAMCKAGNHAGAVHHLRTHAQAYYLSHFSEISSALTSYALNFGSHFSEDRWEMLASMLRDDGIRISAGGSQPPLVALLRAGTLHLHCPTNFSSAVTNPDDPMLSQDVKALCTNMVSTRKDSMLVCAVTGLVMDSENPPMVLPNGRVYSSLGIQELVHRSNDKAVLTCPITSKTFSVSSLRKAVFV